VNASQYLTLGLDFVYSFMGAFIFFYLIFSRLCLPNPASAHCLEKALGRFSGKHYYGDITAVSFENPALVSGV
jgi:hypothetical protein